MPEIALSRNVYISVGTVASEPASGRGREDDIISIPGMWADIDTTEGSHGVSADGLPLPDAHGAEKLLSELGIAPSIVIHSGGGLQCWWLFEEPWVLETPEERNRARSCSSRFGATLVDLGRRHGIHVDDVSDLARLLRPPGTLNHKQGLAVVRLIECDSSRRYQRHEIEAVMVTEVPRTSRPSTCAARRLDRPASRSTTRRGRASRRSRFDSPAEWLNGQVDWAEILEPFGWRLAYQRGEVRYWQHPTATHDVSATTDYGGVPVLACFSSNAGLPVGQGHRLTKFRVFALLAYGGDESAAARAIRDSMRRTR
jgi:hypothetical protein